MADLSALSHPWQDAREPGTFAPWWTCPKCLLASASPFDALCPDLVSQVLDQAQAERDQLRAAIAHLRALDLDAARCRGCGMALPVIHHKLGEGGAYWSECGAHFWPDGYWATTCACGFKLDSLKSGPFPTLRDILPADVLAAIEAPHG